jgi:hypothetical protein
MVREVNVKEYATAFSERRRNLDRRDVFQHINRINQTEIGSWKF